MIGDINTSVSTISSEALDKLFSETPDNQVTADDLNLPADKNGIPSNVTFDKNINVNQQSTFKDVPTIDLDNLEGDKKDDTKDDVKEGEEGKDKKDDVKEVVKPEDKDDEGKDKEKKDKKEKKEEVKETPEEVEAKKEFLKNSVNYLVTKGIFKDFEGREDLEMDEETFSKLLEKQVEAKVDEAYGSKKKSAGEYGEAILEFLENGGEADKIIDLFKERKAVEELSIKDEDSQADLVTKWYKEVHGWKSEKIKKYLDTLNAEEGALETEADDIKSRYKEQYNQQLEHLKVEQKQYQTQQLQKQKAFESNITKAIDTNKEFDDKRRKFIKDAIFNFKTLEDGSKVNAFFLKFAEMQANPEEYIDFADFVMDKEGYLKRKSVDIQNKVVEKTFNFVKGNVALNKNKGSRHVEKDTDTSTGTDFSVVFKS